MKILYITLALIFSSLLLSAQTLGVEELNEIRTGFVPDDRTVALQNILTNDNDIRNNTRNWSALGKVDHFFKYKVEVKGITDQQSSGRCWMFTSMNALRPDVMKMLNIDSFDFSHNFNYFWDLLEKSNLFLENIIATVKKDMDDREVVSFFSTPVNDGGVWNLFYNVAEKYGVVPQSVMPESEHSNNTYQLISVVNERLRAGGYGIRQMAVAGAGDDALRKEKKAVLKDVYRILALCLGEPPTSFAYRYKTKDGEIKSLTTTPLEFYRSIVKEDYTPANYIMIMNDPTREYYKLYEIKNYRNTLEGINWIYLNLPNREIRASALSSIKDNNPLYASCDVGKQINTRAGIMDVNNYNYAALFGVNFAMDKKARILTRQSASSHAMLLIACDTDENDNPVKWEFENSWGASSGNGGYLTFTDEWFCEYLFRLVIHKKYLSPEATAALEQKPVMLPVWDYMY